MNGKDKSDIIERVPMKGICICMCDQKQSWMVSLLIVESGTETTVKRHSRNCQTAAFEFSESVELCRSIADELPVLGRQLQSAWSLDKLTVYKSLKLTSVYCFTHNYCLHWSVP